MQWSHVFQEVQTLALLSWAWFTFVVILNDGRECCLKADAGSLGARLPFGRLSFVLGFTEGGRQKKIVNVWVRSLIFFFLFFLSFLIYISVEHGETKEGWWLSGANRWIQTYMEGLPGCVIVFLLCALSHVCLYYLSVWLSVAVSVSDFCLSSTHLHTHTQGRLMEHKSSFNFLMILITWKLLLSIWALSSMVSGHPWNEHTLCNCVWACPRGVTNLPVIKQQSLFVSGWKSPPSVQDRLPRRLFHSMRFSYFGSPFCGLRVEEGVNKCQYGVVYLKE